jgi:hypothetical protein
MGNDGGSIPDRTSQIKVKKKKKKILEREIKKTKCNLCSLTKEKLKKPIVGDKLGQLYNKKSVIEYLLNKNKPLGFQHIKSLKNVKELKCIINENGYIQCQISQEEFSGLNKFYFLWTCGCVFSKTAIDELHIKDKCINCNIPFDINNDLISLNYNKHKKIEIQKVLLGIKKNNNINIYNEKIEDKKEAILKIFDDKKYEKDNINLLKRKIKRSDDI